MSEKIRVVIVDDHALLRSGVVATLSRSPHIEVVGTGAAGNHVAELLQEHQPDVLITDLHMPAHSDHPDGPLYQSITALSKLTPKYPNTAFVILTQNDSVYTIQNLAQLGVKGYLLKSDDFTDLLDQVVERVHNGRPYFSPEVLEIIDAAPRLRVPQELTNREKEVIRTTILSSTGDRAETAEILFISLSTLQKHITSIKQKFQATSMEQVLVQTIRMGLVGINELNQPFNRGGSDRK